MTRKLIKKPSPKDVRVSNKEVVPNHHIKILSRILFQRSLAMTMTLCWVWQWVCARKVQPDWPCGAPLPAGDRHAVLTSSFEEKNPATFRAVDR